MLGEDGEKDMHLPMKLGPVLGDGATCTVRRLLPPNSHLAAKIIPKASTKYSASDVRRELAVHRSIPPHVNIIQLHKCLQDTQNFYLLMEAAGEGELLEGIEVDVGFPEDECRRHFRDILSALLHIHAHGIAHRDVKPENILMSGGRCKLADFGMATVYRMPGESMRGRPLRRLAGTRMYAAPEVLAVGRGGVGCYYGEQVDVWSLGIILHVMLWGDVPWAEASDASLDFVKFRLRGSLPSSSGVSPKAVNLVEGVLQVDPMKRLQLSDIMMHPWLCESNALPPRQSLSQQFSLPEDDHPATSPLNNCFSQPTTSADVSRVCVARGDTLFRVDGGGVEEQVCDLLSDMSIQWRRSRDGTLVFGTTDRRNQPLVGTISINCDMVIFGKRRGDWLEFKRLFGMIQRELCNFDDS